MRLKQKLQVPQCVDEVEILRLVQIRQFQAVFLLMSVGLKFKFKSKFLKKFGKFKQLKYVFFLFVFIFLYSVKKISLSNAERFYVCFVYESRSRFWIEIELWIQSSKLGKFKTIKFVFLSFFSFCLPNSVRISSLLIGFGEAIQSDGQRENSSEESWEATSAGQEEHQEEVETLQNGGILLATYPISLFFLSVM